MTTLSVVIPVLNESSNLRLLSPLLRSIARSVEIIVVDGGSNDDSVDVAKGFATQVIDSDRGRAMQMNAGAALAQGDYLLFLHADTFPQENLLEAFNIWSNDCPLWGFHSVEFDSNQLIYKLIASLMNLRGQLLSSATGDQGIVVRRDTFAKIGGFAEIPLMEDLKLSDQLRKFAQAKIVQARLKTSTRRWREHGVFRTILLMWKLRIMYRLGVSPFKLAREY